MRGKGGSTMKARFSAVVVVTLVLGSLTWSVPAEAAFRFAITAIDARSGVVTARDQATGKTFRFVVTDKRFLNSLKVGAGGRFDRRSGLAVQGLPQGSYKLVKSPKPKEKPEIDCSSFPQLCPGGK